MENSIEKKYSKKDYASNREVKWCPGCGDYAILSAVQMSLAQLKKDKSQQCFVSGIGCSSRFPVYMNTYGFHTIHGRGPTVATGIKINRPDLDVWLITGDGDALSIGANHLIHLIRRNIDMVVLLFNNRIYGLTKGQYSPTSELNKITKSSPTGSLDNPLSPLSLALSCGASFVARTYDTNIKHMVEVFNLAQKHKGTSFVEILQNCIIFNDGAFSNITDKNNYHNICFLKENEKVSFGKENSNTFKMNSNGLQVIESDNSKEVFVHSCDNEALLYHHSLVLLDDPVAMGVFRRVESNGYDQQLNSKSKLKKNNIQELLLGKNYWRV